MPLSATPAYEALQAEQDVLERAMRRSRRAGEPGGAGTGERLQAVEHYDLGPIASTAGRWTRSADLKLAPFHLLASEGAVHTDKPHTWHMEMIAKLCAADEELLLATPYRLVEVQQRAELR